MTNKNPEQKNLTESPDLWWLIQIYFVLSFIICVEEIYHNSVATGAIELMAVGLAYAGPANFIAALRSRRTRKHSVTQLIIYAVFAAVTASMAIWLMLWSDFRATLFGFKIEGVHWVIAGIVVALLAGRKENE